MKYVSVNSKMPENRVIEQYAPDADRLEARRSTRVVRSVRGRTWGDTRTNAAPS